MALTDLQIKRATEADKPYVLRDGRGLFLVVTPGGGKLWRWKYRFERKEKLMSYGKYPDVSLSRARERHEDARRLLSEGSDPMAVRKAEKTALKEKTEHAFRNIGGLWLEHWRSDKSARHVDVTRRRLEANVYPVIGSKCIAEIEVLELVALAKQIEGRA